MLTSRSIHNKCIPEKFGSANFTFLLIVCRVLRPRLTANKKNTRQKCLFAECQGAAHGKLFSRYVFQMFAECLNFAVDLIRKHTAKVGQV